MAGALFIVATMLHCRTTATVRLRWLSHLAVALVLVLIIQPLGAG